MSLPEQVFTAYEVAEALSVRYPTLQSWIGRGIFMKEHATGKVIPNVQGKLRVFTFNNVMELSVATALIDQGYNLHTSFAAGRVFAHTGECDRLPALPFPDGHTVLYTVESAAKITRWNPSSHPEGGAAILAEMKTGGMFMPINWIFEKVVSGFEYDPAKVICQAYAARRENGPE